MTYKVRVVHIDFDSKKPNKVALEEGINNALKEINGEVTSIDNWTPDNLRGALVVITIKGE